MGDRLGIRGAVGLFFHFVRFPRAWEKGIRPEKKGFAPGEARTHGLQIMRLTRCLLRYGGNDAISQQLSDPTMQGYGEM